MPDPAEIEYMEEPMVKAEIMVTSEYISAIMDLCPGRHLNLSGHGIYRRKACPVLTYHLPLNGIIYDFFDALKSRSGYASFDYEMLGYERSELGETGYPHQ